MGAYLPAPNLPIREAHNTVEQTAWAATGSLLFQHSSAFPDWLNVSCSLASPPSCNLNLKNIKSLLAAIPWGQIWDVTLRIVIWLFLGSAINLIPILAAYVTRAGAQATNGGYSLTTALSSGDLLLAAGVMLPPTLTDLALNAKKAKRTRVMVVIIGALLSVFSLLIYAYAFANNLARENNQTGVATNLSPESVAHLSVGFFLGAVFIGAICAGFLAGEISSSAPTEKTPIKPAKV
jgi:hypothetical protein